jgi:hypothetical protein
MYSSDKPHGQAQKAWSYGRCGHVTDKHENTLPSHERHWRQNDIRGHLFVCDSSRALRGSHHSCSKSFGRGPFCEYQPNLWMLYFPLVIPRPCRNSSACRFYPLSACTAHLSDAGSEMFRTGRLPSDSRRSSHSTRRVCIPGRLRRPHTGNP